MSLRGTGVSGVAAITGGSIGTGTTGLPTLISQSAVAVPCGADTNEDTLATISLAAGLLGANGRVRVRAIFTCTSSANNKTFTVRYSGGAGTIVVQVVQTTISRASMIMDIANRNATNSQITTCSFITSSAASELAPTTSAIDTTAATSIVITGQKASSGEVLQLESYVAEVIH
jgi:hypothetical protein